VPATVIIAYLLPADRAGAPGVALYSLGLSLMAATAWTSRFHRFRVGIGAVMFVVSDLLIFARAGRCRTASRSGWRCGGCTISGSC
jgi:uncharacterized membrane protein YhhN